MEMSGQDHSPAAVHPRKNFGGRMGPIARLDSFKKVKIPCPSSSSFL
jgi:hypothetical protein